jgi:hypothetical protein
MHMPRQSPFLLESQSRYTSSTTKLSLFPGKNSNNKTKKKKKENAKSKNPKSSRSAKIAATRQNIGSSNSISEFSPASMQTALCILPPADAWDNLQRARHISRDRSYTRWPPCIRLFHPFCTPNKIQDTALQLADIIEKYNIQPFTVHFNQWMVIPHTEAMEADWLAMQQMSDGFDDDDDGSAAGTKDDATADFDRLVAREEELGRRNRRNRQIQAAKKEERARLEQEGNSTATSAAPKTIPPVYKAPETQSHRQLLENQKRMYEEFNGPCVVCLEPDDESKEKLIELRELLRRELFTAYDKYSPSSTVSDVFGHTLPRQVLELDELIEYRPLVTVGSFPTVTSAIEMARKLRGLWDPLTFDVMDLQLISCDQDSVLDGSSGNGNTNFDTDNPAHSPEQRPPPPAQRLHAHKTSWMSHVAGEDERNFQLDEQFGCDAAVMLMGEEEPTDRDLTQEMVNFICEKGEAGGFEDTQKKKKYDNGQQQQQQQQRWSEPLDIKNGNMEDLEYWLNQDDEGYDEGTVVVIGRTHFFTGEMRKYVGMPATSAMDAKDRAMGGSVSGAARRRGAIHRNGNLWGEGEWGRRESDLRPRTKNKRLDS